MDPLMQEAWDAIRKLKAGEEVSVSLECELFYGRYLTHWREYGRRERKREAVAL